MFIKSEQVLKWEADREKGRFTIKDLAELGMRIEKSSQNEYIRLHSDGKVPFEFTLTVFLAPAGESLTDVHFEFDGKVPPMIAMMGKKPLTNLVNHMASRVPVLVEGDAAVGREIGGKPRTVSRIWRATTQSCADRRGQP